MNKLKMRQTTAKRIPTRPFAPVRLFVYIAFSSHWLLAV